MKGGFEEKANKKAGDEGCGDGSVGKVAAEQGGGPGFDPWHPQKARCGKAHLKPQFWEGTHEKIPRAHWRASVPM